MDPEQKEQLNDELLKEECEEDKAAKRNSKDDIIRKILLCCQENDIELRYSNTKLRRMTKHQLLKLLGEVLEEKIRDDLAAQVGAGKGAPNSVIALGALKMVHNIAANTAEKGLNIFLPQYGYEIDGFTRSLKDPAVDEAVTMCLTEIAAETDVLKYIESPYSRLAIAWAGALISSLKKTNYNRTNRESNAARMGPREARGQNSVQPRISRGPAHGEKFRSFGPAQPNVKTV